MLFLPITRRRAEEGSSGVRGCKEVAVLDPFALHDLLGKLPSASCVLAQNTVRSSCFNLLKRTDTLRSPRECATFDTLVLNIWSTVRMFRLHGDNLYHWLSGQFLISVPIFFYSIFQYIFFFSFFKLTFDWNIMVVLAPNTLFPRNKLSLFIRTLQRFLASLALLCWGVFF